MHGVQRATRLRAVKRIAATRSKKKFDDRAVEQIFASVSPDRRKRLLALRDIILETAAATPGVGKITETLKWNEPAYLTAHSKSGTTIRINVKKNSTTKYAMYFNCHTGLIDSFRGLFPGTFVFHGDREIEFDVRASVPSEALRVCVEMALTYHLNNRSRRAKS